MTRASALLVCLSAVSLPLAAHAQDRTARIESVQGEVVVSAPEQHPARAGETLAAGTRINTHAGNARISIENATLALGESTAMMLFGSPTPPAPHAPVSNDTSIQRGSVRVTVAAGAAIAIAGPAAWASFSTGDEGTVRVDAGRATQVAVTHGNVRVRAAGRETSVRAGTGVRAEVGRPATAPRPLPAPPTWITPPPSALLSSGDPMDLPGVFGYPLGHGPPAAHWHVQVARDERFQDPVLDTTVGGSSTRLQAHALAPGAYFVRVSALDADRFEGAFGPVARSTISAPRITPAGHGHRATVQSPEGFYCGLDGAPIALNAGPFALSPARAHSLRCAARADGTGAQEINISADQAGAMIHVVRVEPEGFDSSGGMRVLVLELSDSSGAPISYATIRVTASDGTVVSEMRENERRGFYTGTVQWPRGASGVHLHFVVNDASQFDYDLGRREASNAQAP